MGGRAGARSGAVGADTSEAGCAMVVAAAAVVATGDCCALSLALGGPLCCVPACRPTCRYMYLYTRVSVRRIACRSACRPAGPAVHCVQRPRLHEAPPRWQGLLQPHGGVRRCVCACVHACVRAGWRAGGRAGSRAHVWRVACGLQAWPSGTHRNYRMGGGRGSLCGVPTGGRWN